MPKIKNPGIFLICFILSYTGFYSYSEYRNKKEIEKDARENEVIIESLKNRFRLFMDYPITIGIIGAEYFSTHSFEKDYSSFAHDLLKTKRELLGLNLVDETGKIVKVYPEASNQRALGQVTQNFSRLKESFDRGEPYWFSPPFDLYQNGQGFVLYFPIVENKKLKGWFATVLQTELFAKDFELTSLLKQYNIKIEDRMTGHPYYDQGVIPAQPFVYSEVKSLHGREIVYISTSKVRPNFLSKFFIAVLAVITSIIAVLLIRYFKLRKQTHDSLLEFNTLLKLTSNEAMNKLIDLQNEIHKLGSSENAHYVMNLIEQIDLLRTTANSMDKIESEEINLLETLKQELKETEELLNKKSLGLLMNETKFENIKVMTNPWMFKNFVISNILTFSIFQSESGSLINIIYQRINKHHMIQFHTLRAYREEAIGKTLNLDRRLEVAKAILKLNHGDLKVEEDLGSGLTVQIFLPA